MTGDRTRASVETVNLEPGAPVVRSFVGGGSMTALVRVPEGAFARIDVEQRGVDVVLRLISPGGEALTEVDSPIGATGVESVSLVAVEGGDYRIDVESTDPGEGAGEIELRIEEVRQATPEDRIRVASEREFALGEVSRRGGEPEAALEHYRRSLGHARSSSDEERSGLCLDRIAQLLDRMGRHAEALEALEEAIRLSERAGNPFRQAVSLNRAGLVHTRQGRLEEAERCHRRAIELFRASGDGNAPHGEASAQTNLGSVLRRTGRIQEALDAFDAALALWRRLDDPEAIATLLHLGATYISQGLLDRAQAVLMDALAEAEERSDPRMEMLAHHHLGTVRHRQSRYEEAAEHLERARALRRELGDRRGAAVTLNSLGTLRLKAGDRERAGSAYREALDVFAALDDAHGLATAHLNLGRYHFALGEDRAAAREHLEAIEHYRRIQDETGIASTRFGAARALYRLGDFAAALEHLEASLAYVEQARLGSLGHEFRAAYFATKEPYWELYIATLMRLHDLDAAGGYARRAFEALERWRARSLLELIVEGRGDVRAGAPPALVAEERRIGQQLSELSAARMRLDDPGPDPEALLEQEQALLFALERIRMAIRESSAGYAALDQPRPLTVSEVQRRVLDDDTRLLAYFLADERSFLWAVSRDSLVSLPLAGRTEIEQAARAVHDSGRRGGKLLEPVWKAAAQELSRLVLEPAAELLTSPRLVVIADGDLQYVPFAALPRPAADPGGSGARLLIEDSEVVSLPSASVLAVLRRQLEDRMPPPNWLAVVADPVFEPDDPRLSGGGGPPAEATGDAVEPEVADGAGSDVVRAAADVGLERWVRLPGSAVEADSILHLASGRPTVRAVGFDASKRSVVDGALDSYRILHFATHGSINEIHPELSGLVLSLFDRGGRPIDGFLRLHEIYELELQADLVVLSACRTGLGEKVSGEGLVGLTRGFMYAGVPRLVVSLWNIGDRSSAELMSRMYEGLIAGLAPAAALRAAQLSMLADPEWQAPRHWAGFVFQGDWQAPAEVLVDGPPIERVETGGTEPPDESDVDLPPPKVRSAQV